MSRIWWLYYWILHNISRWTNSDACQTIPKYWPGWNAAKPRYPGQYLKRKPKVQHTHTLIHTHTTGFQSWWAYMQKFQTIYYRPNSTLHQKDQTSWSRGLYRREAEVGQHCSASNKNTLHQPSEQEKPYGHLSRQMRFNTPSYLKKRKRGPGKAA